MASPSRKKVLLKVKRALAILSLSTLHTAKHRVLSTQVMFSIRFHGVWGERERVRKDSNVILACALDVFCFSCNRPFPHTHIHIQQLVCVWGEQGQDINHGREANQVAKAQVKDSLGGWGGVSTIVGFYQESKAPLTLGVRGIQAITCSNPPPPLRLVVHPQPTLFPLVEG